MATPDQVQATVNASIPDGESNFTRMLKGYGPSTKIPVFDNNPHKFANWRNQLHHYLLVLDVYKYLKLVNITESQNKDLYMAIANCLTETSLNLVASKAFGKGLEAYKLICQKFLGNADAREAATMIEITDVSQHESETLAIYLDRFEQLKNRLDEFGTIAKSNFYVVLCLRGLHTKYHMFKNIISTGKTPDWDSFKEKIESHSAMMSLDNKKTNQILYIKDQNFATNNSEIYNTQYQVPRNNTKICKRCFGKNHLTEECYSNKYCHQCGNASHNTFECRFQENQNVDYNFRATNYTSPRESRQLLRGPPQQQRGRSAQPRSRGSTPGRTPYTNTQQSHRGRSLTPQGQRSMNNVIIRDNTVNHNNPNFENSEIDQNAHFYKNFETDHNNHENFEKQSDHINNTTQTSNNTETVRPNFNNLFL